MHGEPRPESVLGPEKKPPEAYTKSLRVQSTIVGRFDDEAERHRWIEENSALFRQMMDEDESFAKLVIAENVDAVLAALEERKRH